MTQKKTNMPSKPLKSGSQSYTTSQYVWGTMKSGIIIVDTDCAPQPTRGIRAMSPTQTRKLLHALATAGVRASAIQIHGVENLESAANRLIIEAQRAGCELPSENTLWKYSMSLTINKTQEYQDNIASFSSKEKTKISRALKKMFDSFADDKAFFLESVKAPTPVSLKGFESSLYIFEATDQHRVFLTIEEDPIFEETIFTLIKATYDKDVEGAYVSVAKKLLYDFIAPATKR